MGLSMLKNSAVAGFWLLSIAVLIVPGGVVTQIWKANERFRSREAESPLGKLCYFCNAPAVHSAQYDDGGVRYFCIGHTPPEQVHADSTGEHGRNSFNPWFCITVLGGIYGIHALRSLLQLYSTAKLFQASLPGALIGMVFSAMAWFWFAAC